MERLLKDKATEAGLPDSYGEQGFEDHLEELKVKNVDQLESDSERRAAKVKNISLRLLSVTSP